MARSLREQMVSLGIVLPADTPEARMERDRARRRETDLAEERARFDHVGQLPRFEAPARLATAPSSSVVPAELRVTCDVCGRDWPQGMMVMPDLCRECNGGDVERLRGSMEWIHKSVPVLHIDGRPATSPEEYSAMRRR